MQDIERENLERRVERFFEIIFDVIMSIVFFFVGGRLIGQILKHGILGRFYVPIILIVTLGADTVLILKIRSWKTDEKGKKFLKRFLQVLIIAFSAGVLGSLYLWYTMVHISGAFVMVT